MIHRMLNRFRSAPPPTAEQLAHQVGQLIKRLPHTRVEYGQENPAVSYLVITDLKVAEAMAREKV